MKSALITGITGQDGSYLAELLLEKGYKVFGLCRRTSVGNLNRIKHLLDKVEILDGDLLDFSSLIQAIKVSKPDEIYNLAAQSFVGASFKEPLFTAKVTGLGALNVFEAARLVKPDVRIYQASSSEMFGKVRATPQNEETPFHPRSPYGVAKVFAHYSAINYRESYDMFICNGILFNHESPRRGEEFVTRKISLGVAKIHLGLANSISLGNLDAKRDWGYAGDYVRAMWMMLQQDEPKDFVIGTGETHSIRDFLDLAFTAIGIDDWSPHIKTDPKFYRPAEVDVLIADFSKAKNEFAWEPKHSFKELVEIMVKADIALLKHEDDQTKVLVTGGTGFLGRNIIPLLLANGMSVTNLDLKPYENAKVDSLIFNALEDNLHEVLNDKSFDYIIHLAAYSSPQKAKDKEKTWKINVDLTEELLKAASKMKDLKEFFFFSTVLTYAEDAASPFDENAAQAAKEDDFYTNSKIAAEKICFHYLNEGLSVKIFRLTNCFGPYEQFPNNPHLIPQIIQSAFEEEQITIFNGSYSRDFLYSKDLARIVLDSILNPKDFSVLNVATGKSHTVEEVANTLSKELDKAVVDLKKELNSQSNLSLDTSRFKKHLPNFEFTPFEKAIKESLSYYQDRCKENK